ncbi:MAG: hypothetical protein WC863_00805 [Patescibacteria group bacterium]
MIYHDKINKNNAVEWELVAFLLYFIFLVITIFTIKNLLAVLYIHIALMILFSIYYFGRELFYILIAPLFVILYPLNSFQTKRFLKKVQLNKSCHTVVVLAHSNWRKLEAWIKPNFNVSEIKLLYKYLKKRGDDFSFYPKATLDDVNDLMADPNIKEIYFYGHGSSHVFQLGTGEYLYYCEFSNGKYEKDFVHQMHCGTEDGKSLVDYVVPDKNKKECFWVKKSITGPYIEKILKKKIKEIGKDKV